MHRREIAGMVGCVHTSPTAAPPLHLARCTPLLTLLLMVVLTLTVTHSPALTFTPILALTLPLPLSPTVSPALIPSVVVLVIYAGQSAGSSLSTDTTPSALPPPFTGCPSKPFRSWAGAASLAAACCSGRKPPAGWSGCWPIWWCQLSGLTSTRRRRRMGGMRCASTASRCGRGSGEGRQQDGSSKLHSVEACRCASTASRCGRE